MREHFSGSETGTLSETYQGLRDKLDQAPIEFQALVWNKVTSRATFKVKN